MRRKRSGSTPAPAPDSSCELSCAAPAGRVTRLSVAWSPEPESGLLDYAPASPGGLPCAPWRSLFLCFKVDCTLIKQLTVLGDRGQGVLGCRGIFRDFRGSESHLLQYFHLSFSFPPPNSLLQQIPDRAHSPLLVIFPPFFYKENFLCSVLVV